MFLCGRKRGLEVNQYENSGTINKVSNEHLKLIKSKCRPIGQRW